MNQIRNAVVQVNRMIGDLRADSRPTFEETLGSIPFKKEESKIEYLSSPTTVYVIDLDAEIETELLLTVFSQQHEHRGKLETVYQIQDLMVRTPSGVVNPAWNDEEYNRYMKNELAKIREIFREFIKVINTYTKPETLRGEDLVYRRTPP